MHAPGARSAKNGKTGILQQGKWVLEFGYDLCLGYWLFRQIFCRCEFIPIIFHFHAPHAERDEIFGFID